MKPVELDMISKQNVTNSMEYFNPIKRHKCWHDCWHLFKIWVTFQINWYLQWLFCMPDAKQLKSCFCNTYQLVTFDAVTASNARPVKNQTLTAYVNRECFKMKIIKRIFQTNFILNTVGIFFWLVLHAFSDLLDCRNTDYLLRSKNLQITPTQALTSKPSRTSSQLSNLSFQWPQWS